MRPSTRSLASYSDVEQLLNRVLTSGPINLQFISRQQATRFIARANKFRVLWRQEEERKGREYASPYDHLSFSRIPEEDGSYLGGVRLAPRGYNFVSALDDAGNPVTLSAITAAEPPARPHALSEREADDEDFLSDFIKSNPSLNLTVGKEK